MHRLAHRDHREPGLDGDALGGAVPGARLVRVDGGVGHEVDAGAHDARAVRGDYDRAVHFAQFAEAGRGELDVELEAAGADLLDEAVAAHDDERAGAAPQDALEAVAQRGAGRHGGQGRAQALVRDRRHGYPQMLDGPPGAGGRAVEVTGSFRGGTSGRLQCT
ncbi:hypothetical protein ADL26_08095, partial [Thermoactinomyces vulgaris]